MNRVIGMYVHQHWSYNYPYAARTWKEADWVGYINGLAALGYNTLMIWPMIDTMPSPRLDTDKEQLSLLSRVIKYARTERGMQIIIVFTPNIRAVDEKAATYDFANRSFFEAEKLVDPNDAAAVSDLLQRRKSALALLGPIDAIAVIDSDPGGYPGSDHADFIELLAKHRAMLDSLQPGVKLIYWMHAGWRSYGKWYETGRFQLNSPADWLAVLNDLAARNLNDWALLGHHECIREVPSLNDRLIYLRYGAVEGEPVFPMTRYDDELAFEAGAFPSGFGTLGNAQTHVVQLPNTFAFARGAQGAKIGRSDYLEFAERLIPSCGEIILSGWEALQGEDIGKMKDASDALLRRSREPVSVGDLSGLLLGGAGRFLEDLVLQLNLRIAWIEFRDSSARQPSNPAVLKFARAADEWQKRTGYQNYWYFDNMEHLLRALDIPAINHIYDSQTPILPDTFPFEKMPGETHVDKIREGLRQTENFTTRVISALLQASSRESR